LTTACYHLGNEKVGRVKLRDDGHRRDLEIVPVDQRHAAAISVVGSSPVQHLKCRKIIGDEIASYLAIACDSLCFSPCHSHVL